MTDMKLLVSDALRDFSEVAVLAQTKIPSGAITVEIVEKPHTAPKFLPLGRMAVYAFFLNGQALKVGKVGSKSAARYTSQHYNPASANSTLAQSILSNVAKVGATGINHDNAGEWIRTHTDRVNLLLPIEAGIAVLSLLEAFLHVRWKPMFEGRSEGC